jgi:hypothetical protein
MRKTNAPPPSSRKARPLEEVHLDLFTYPDDPRYDAFFIDRGKRACWHYVLRKKSELPAIVQQFIVDANTLDYPVGRMGPEKAQVTILRSSSPTSTSSTQKAFKKVNTKTASQSTAVACDS